MLLYNQFVYALGEVSQLLLQLGEEKQGCQWQVRTAWEMVKQLNSMPLFFLENWQAPSLRGWGSYPCATSSPLYSISGLFILKAFKNSSVLLPCTEGLLSVFHLVQMPCREVILVKEGQNHQFVYVRHGFWPSWALAYLSWALAYRYLIIWVPNPTGQLLYQFRWLQRILKRFINVLIKLCSTCKISNAGY